jgi:hypothetical protein
MIKKLKSHEQIEKERKRNQLIIGVVMVFLLTFSSIGYALLDRNVDTTKTENYQGLKFQYANGFWTTIINQKTFYFSEMPSELKNISANGSFSLSSYENKKLYFVNYNPAAQSILIAMDGIVTNYQEACLDGMICSNLDLPVKSCSDNVIIFTQGDETTVSKKDNCVYLTGNFYKASDVFVYKLLNLM